LKNESKNVSGLSLVTQWLASAALTTQELLKKGTNPSPSLQRQRFGDFVLLQGALPMILFCHCQSVALEAKQTNNLATDQKWLATFKQPHISTSSNTANSRNGMFHYHSHSSMEVQITANHLQSHCQHLNINVKSLRGGVNLSLWADLL